MSSGIVTKFGVFFKHTTFTIDSHFYDSINSVCKCINHRRVRKSWLRVEYLCLSIRNFFSFMP